MSSELHRRERERVCFLLQLKRDRVTDYLEAHRTVWPEMLASLRTAGWHNYSLFVRPEDGLVVGYLETDDFDAATSAMAQTAVNTAWQSSMAEYFEASDHPDRAMHRLTEYFHLP
ncbi:L-rhamnose mutarotase [Mycolicibacterium sp. S2-37]|uniref:L-rhamnose mutarotase n=1 Tax=Mycolicibacterium sp. S2-37 TaxID=2810297 RepID=UPI001A94040E|nr:L-rhamnose mutarotase [Mycolicibacterium sp. S2-37]MBO0679351.1 L-rhamnose mutarotase [Mycolicibacterium sp. S2-37]